MKVRFTHDSIRFRLNQSEVRTLGEGRPVQMETLVTGGTYLRSIVQPSSAETIVLSLQPYTIVADVPRQQLLAWANGDLVMLQSHQDNGAAGSLTILIEKDFHCLHRDTIDDADTFPNPKKR